MLRVILLLNGMVLMPLTGFGLAAEEPAPAQPAGEASFSVFCADPAGKPIEGMLIEVSDRSFNGEPLPEVTLHTNAQGEAKIPLGPDGKSAGRLVAKKFGFLKKTLDWETEAAGLDTNLRLYRFEAGGSMRVSFSNTEMVGGVVLSTREEPIPEAEVTLFGVVKESSNAAQEWVEKKLAIVRTDSAGRWTCDSLPPTVRDISLSVAAKRYFRVDQFPEGPNGDWISQEVLLSNQAKTVLPDAVGVKLDISSAAPLDCEGWLAFTPDDDVGGRPAVEQRHLGKWNGSHSFTLGGMGDFTTMVWARNHAPTLIKSRMTGKPLELTLKLDPGRSMQGSVVTTDGTPVAKTQVFLRGIGAIYPEEKPVIAVTDDNGKFTWSHAPSETSFRVEANNITVTISPRETEILLKIRPPLKQ